MPILKNAKKALRVSKRKAEMNQPIKSQVKTVMDSVKKKPSAQTLSNAFSAIDRAVKRNIFHKKKAARLKSQMAKLVAAAAQRPTETKPAKEKMAKAKAGKKAKK